MGRGRGGNDGASGSVVATRASKTENTVDIEERLRGIEETNIGTAAFSASYFEGTDGTFVPSLTYCTDYKYEEEAGVGELRKAITSENPRQFKMSPDARKHITLFDDANAIAFSTREVPATSSWGDALPGAEQDYTKYMSSRLDSTQRVDSEKLWGNRWARPTVKEMRAKAEELGLPKPYPTKRADLLEFIYSSKQVEKENPNQFPGSFSTGDTLVLRADDDSETGEMVRRIRKAVEEGHLGIGNASGPFSTGITFYDTRYETPKMIEDREAAFDLYDKRMAPVPEVKEQLIADGWRVYAVSRPTEIKNEETGVAEIKYWLNAVKNGKQEFGYYTLDELRAGEIGKEE